MFTDIKARNGELYISSFELARVTGKPHGRILLDINEERAKLQALSPNLVSVDKTFLEAALEGFSEESYIDSAGRVLPMYNLSEEAAAFVLLRYSYEFRVRFMRLFGQYRSALIRYLQAETVAKHIPQKPLSRRYVYIISNPVTGSFKIGIAKDIEKRLQALQTGNEVELTLFYASLACSNASLIETDVHKHFAEYRLVGEWFSSKLDELDVIDYLKEQNYILESNFGEEHEIL